MRWPRPRVRMLLIAVAVIALGIGGWLEYRRLKRLSDKYALYAWTFESNVRMRAADLAVLQPKLDRMIGDPKADPAQVQLLGVTVDWLHANIAANANLVQIYEHAASHPWEAPPIMPRRCPWSERMRRSPGGSSRARPVPNPPSRPAGDQHWCN